MTDAAALWDLVVSDIEEDVRTRCPLLRGQLIERPGIIGALRATIPFPLYVHSAAADLHDGVAQVRGTSPLPRIHLLSSHPDGGLLEAAGWSVEQVITQMVLSNRGAPADQPLPAGLRLESLAVPDQIAEFYLAMAAGFEERLSETIKELPREVISTQGIQLFVARDGHGAVIGTAGARRRGSGANLFAISVVPEHRGRGIARALTELASDAMFAAGARSVQLYATSAGLGVYERAGFEVAGQWVFYRPLAQSPH